MLLNPEIGTALKGMPGAALSGSTPLARQRLATEQLVRFHGTVSVPFRVETKEHVWTENRCMAVREFHPCADTGRNRIVFLHGGGWVAGSLDLYDTPARMIAAKSRCPVYLPDYPLAPELPYPIGLNAIADFVSSLAQADEGPIWLVGDSAGANMALGVTLLLKDREQDSIQRLVLFYPPVSPDALDYALDATQGLLGVKAMQMNWAHYLGDSLPDARRYCDFGAAVFRGFPPVDLFLAELDILRPEGELLRRSLARDGVLGRSLTLEGMPHAALHFFGVSAGAAAIYDLFADFG